MNEEEELKEEVARAVDYSGSGLWLGMGGLLGYKEHRLPMMFEIEGYLLLLHHG